MNKPVAWTEKDLRNACRNARLSEDDFFRIKAYLPIDTHPVKEHKEPSVKEIDDLWIEVINNIPENDNRPKQWHFARAILRKAQEK